MKKLLASIFIATGFLLGIGSTVYATVSTFRVVETPPYHLYTGEAGSAVTIRITPFPVDLDGTKFTMTDFGSNPTLTVDPGLKGIEEIESFTGITDNGDGTATLTGLTRNLTSKYPYTTAGTGRTHGSGAIVVFGNNPQVYGRLAAPENTNTWTADQTYASTTHPGFDLDPGAAYYTTGPNTTFVDYAQLARTALAGTVNGSYIVTGVYQAARPIEAASSTLTGSTGAMLALTSQIATSSCTVATSSVVMTQTNGKVSQGCIDQSFSYIFTGNVIHNGTTTFNKAIIAGATSSQPNSATTTIDWSFGNTFEIYLTGNQSFVFTNVTAGESIKMIIHQDGSGSRTINNWGNTSTTTMRWAGAFAPTLSTTAGTVDIISLSVGTTTAFVYGAATTNFR